MDKYRRQELFFYILVWALVFALVPLVMGLHVVSGHEHGFSFGDVWTIWCRILPFLLLFLVHDQLVLNLTRGKRGLQITMAVLLLGVFCVYVLRTGRQPSELMPPEPPSAMQSRPPLPPGPPLRQAPDNFREAPADGQRPLTPEVMKIIIGALLLMANTGTRAYVKSRRDEQRLLELQARNMSQQLEALRYQINPHFFMNTLNNIHALVDIDPDKAKESIEEFSKAMRVVLYEGSEPTIPLAREIEFIGHFISLMRLRYPQSVRIDVSFPEQDVPASVPPLLMASFVENAFKHGISYEQESFVRVSLAQERDKVVFKCVNSRHPDQGRVRHGLGLENIRKRLDLLYGGTYVLQVDETSGVYDILLVLPMEPPYPAKSFQP